VIGVQWAAGFAEGRPLPAVDDGPLRDQNWARSLHRPDGEVSRRPTMLAQVPT
jgi:hypothetical protein